ncbi:MAG: hypothetical protein Q8Q28_14815 [Pseudomonadota bacterium]|nr:hypothetical protein [Pseudomonadota bacterium]
MQGEDALGGGLRRQVSAGDEVAGRAVMPGDAGGGFARLGEGDFPAFEVGQQRGQGGRREQGGAFDAELLDADALVGGFRAGGRLGRATFRRELNAWRLGGGFRGPQGVEQAAGIGGGGQGRKGEGQADAGQQVI